MEKTNIIGTGLDGLLGSRITELLEKKYTFTNISRSTGVDISKKEQVIPAVTHADGSFVLHLAAIANVDACEQDKQRGKDGDVWKINVEGTGYIADACKQAKKKLIYISTDFVFDGQKVPPAGGYTEEDKPNPINWYGVTKYEAEKLVQQSGTPYVIIRPAYPYGRRYAQKKDFVQAVLGRLESGQSVQALTDHIFTPTFLDDLVAAIDALIMHNAEGIYHVVGSQSLTPYDAGLTIAEVFGYDRSLIQKTTREEFFAGRAMRPYNLSVRNDKIEKLGVKMRGFEEGLAQVKMTNS